MQIPRTRDTKVIIDNNSIEWDRWEVIHNTDHTKRVFLDEDVDPINIRIMVRLKNGTIVEFTPEAYESTKDTVYIYGLLRAIFPEMAQHYYLDPWQVAFLKHKAEKANVLYRSIDRFKTQKNSLIFTTTEAQSFKSGWYAAKEDTG